MLAKSPFSRDALDALLDGPDTAVLAVIAGVEGPSYRPVGSMMTVLSDSDWAGTLSSGCIEADISLHAMQISQGCTPRHLRYGRGSPFVDIQLPCGGGLDILLLPAPDRAVLRALKDNRLARIPCALRIDAETGLMEIVAPTATARTGAHLTILFEPDIRFVIFGKRPEASAFAALVQAAGYPNLLVSPDDETLNAGAQAGCETKHIVRQAFPEDVEADARTAIILFFHDHDWEPPILVGALRTEAFYIGAQGSQRARDARLMELQALGVGTDDMARLHGPVGLIPSARDAHTLAV
ncbi:MAG: XdhC family protein, partial [Pseudomonadota bacterium]